MTSTNQVDWLNNVVSAKPQRSQEIYKEDESLPLIQVATPLAETPPALPHPRRSRLLVVAFLVLAATQGVSVYSLMKPTAPVAAAVPLPLPILTKAEATELVVSPQGEGEMRSIAQALAEAKPGMRIRVKPGVYKESLRIEKPVELVGDGPLRDIVIESEHADALHIASSDVVVRNLTLRTKGADRERACYGLHISKGRPVVEACDISGEGMGCVLVTGADTAPTLRGCVVHDGKGAGILVTQQAKGLFQACRSFGNSQAGFVISSQAHPILMGCSVSDGRDAGLIVNAKGLATMVNCEFAGNKTIGVLVRGKEAHAMLRDCVIKDNQGDGVQVREEAAATLDVCQVLDNLMTGVSVQSKAEATVVRSKIQRSKYSGVYVQESRAAVVSCEIEGNANKGVSVVKGGAVTALQTRLASNTLGDWNVDSESRVLGTNNAPAAPTRTAAAVPPTPSPGAGLGPILTIKPPTP